MKNPSASGRGIETDLPVELRSTLQNSRISPQSGGKFTLTRLKKIEQLEKFKVFIIYENDLKKYEAKII